MTKQEPVNGLKGADWKRLLGAIVLIGWFAGGLFAQLQVSTASPLPGGVTNVVYSQTLGATGGTQPYTHWNLASGSGPLPTGLTLSDPGGVIGGTPTVAGTYNFVAQVTATGGGTATKPLSITITAPLSITTTTLPDGKLNAVYANQTLTAAGGTPGAGYTWSITTGAMQPGLSLSAAGVISGTPTATGTFTFTVRVADSSAPQLATTKSLSITVAPPLAVTTTALPDGKAGAAYFPQTLSATGGTPGTGYTWTVSAGTLPAGLSLSTAGVISGTPSSPGTASFTVRVADSSSPQQTATAALAISVTSTSITTTSLPNGNVGVSYPFQVLSATGGTPPYIWSISGGALPTGMVLSGGGVISGTPSLAGTFGFTVRATDTGNPQQAATADLSIAVPPTILTNSLAAGTAGIAYSQTLTAALATTALTWSVFSGPLPPGLSLDPATGVISGTPTVTGTYNVTFAVSDASSPALTATKALPIAIQTGLTITTQSPLPVGVIGVFYSVPISASGPAQLNWTVISQILPPGLQLSANGTVFGTPTVAGTFDFTVQAAGGDPVQTASQTLRIVINGSLTITTFAALPDANLSVPYSVTLAATGGVAPYTWTNPGTKLPSGLVLSAAGVISGTPTTLGNFTVTLQVADSFTPSQQVSRNFTIAVTSALTITTTSVPDAIVNVAYNQQLLAAGTGTLAWTVTDGTLPTGITLSASGLLQGTPLAVGSSSFTVTVTDSRVAASSQALTLTVNPALSAFSVRALPSSLSPTASFGIALSLAAPHPGALTGQLNLSFTSKAEVASNDPMTQFSTGSRSVSFTIAANTTDAVFPTNILLLTGTVAGTVTLTANIVNGPSNVPVGSVEILAVAPHLTNVAAVKTAGGLEVQITGYASARRVTSVEFTFVLTSGKSTQTVTLSRSVDAEFNVWFSNPASTTYGGSFSFVQSFSVAGGDTSAIQTVTVRLTNAQGSTSSGALTPQ